VGQAKAAEPFTGLYAGIAVAPSIGSFNGTNVDVGETSQSRLHGTMGGLEAGYNWQTGGLVLGIEAEQNFGGVRYKTDMFGIPTSTDVTGLGSVRGRIGWAAAPSLMIFATGGLGWGNDKISGSAFGGSSSYSKEVTGFAGGAGLEYKLDRNWSLKGEWIRYELGSVDLTPVGAAGVDYRNTVDSFKLGLNYKF
jgi:outer membrane immunogenic protein